MGKLLRRVAIAAALGSVVMSLALLAVQRYVDRTPENLTTYGYALFKVRLVLWPSLMMLMRTSGIASSPMGYVVLAISLALNAILYALSAVTFCWLVIWIRSRVRRP